MNRLMSNLSLPSVNHFGFFFGCVANLDTVRRMGVLSLGLIKKRGKTLSVMYVRN